MKDGKPVLLDLGLAALGAITMPLWLVLLLIVVFGVVGVVSASAWLYAFVARPIWHVASLYEYRWPLRRRRPLPHQWLLDVAEQDRASSPSILITHQTLIWPRFEERRPNITFMIDAFNGSVHNLLIGKIKGSVSYKGQPLETAIEDISPANSTIEKRSPFQIRFKQYLPSDIIEDVKAEIASGYVTCFNTSGITYEATPIIESGVMVVRPASGMGGFTVLQWVPCTQESLH